MIVWAASVAFPQVYVGIHYPVDVSAGAVLGSLIGLVFALVYRHFIGLPADHLYSIV
jgi:undecaprenyl-diphosphatase